MLLCRNYDIAAYIVAAYEADYGIVAFATCRPLDEVTALLIRYNMKNK